MPMFMIPKAIRSAVLAAAGLAVLAAIAPASAKDYADPSWPCVARKVEELSAGQVWDGPALDDATGWQSDDDVRKLSAYLISRRIKIEDVEAAIKKFADKLPADTRDQKLTELFAAVLSRANDERKIVMSGIERFNKRQLARAKEIEKAGISLPKDGEDASAPDTAIPDAGAVGKASTAQEKYNWDVRIFQERQQAIPIACEIPQLMDERTGAIARAIRAQMKS